MPRPARTAAQVLDTAIAALDREAAEYPPAPVLASLVSAQHEPRGECERCFKLVPWAQLAPCDRCGDIICRECAPPMPAEVVGGFVVAIECPRCRRLEAQ